MSARWLSTTRTTIGFSEPARSGTPELCAPGLIDTGMTQWVIKRPSLLPGILAQMSLGRPGDIREIGTVVAFFASEEASYLTGQSIHVDGGWEGK